jgi:hypothetical protein
MSKKTAINNPPAHSKVKLLAPHRHAGVLYAAGDSLQVTAIEQQWLIERGLIACESAAPAADLPQEE